MSKNEETPWYCDVFAVNSIRTLDRKLSGELWIIYILLWDSCEEKIRWFFPTNSSQSGDHDWKISFVLNLVRFSTLVTFAFKLHMWIHKKGQDKTLNLNEPNPYSSLFFPFYPLKVEKMMFRCQVSSCCTSSWACPCSSDWWPWPWPWPPNIDSLSFKVRTPSTMLHKETAANTWFVQISRATCEGFTCAFWGDQCSSTGESNSSRMTIQNR